AAAARPHERHGRPALDLEGDAGGRAGHAAVGDVVVGDVANRDGRLGARRVQMYMGGSAAPLLPQAPPPLRTAGVPGWAAGPGLRGAPAKIVFTPSFSPASGRRRAADRRL